MEKNQDLTIKSISDLLDNKFSENNKLVFSRLDGIDDRLNAQSERLTKLENEVKNGFGWVSKKLQEMMGKFDESEDKKIKKLQDNLEPRIEKLEHRVFA